MSQDWTGADGKQNVVAKFYKTQHYNEGLARKTEAKQTDQLEETRHDSNRTSSPLPVTFALRLK